MSSYPYSNTGYTYPYGAVPPPEKSSPYPQPQPQPQHHGQPLSYPQQHNYYAPAAPQTMRPNIPTGGGGPLQPQHNVTYVVNPTPPTTIVYDTHPSMFGSGLGLGLNHSGGYYNGHHGLFGHGGSVFGHHGAAHHGGMGHHGFGHHGFGGHGFHGGNHH